MTTRRQTTLLLSGAELMRQMRTSVRLAENAGRHLEKTIRFVEDWGYVFSGVPATSSNGMLLKARHTLMGKTRALKLFFFGDSDPEEERTRFETEARLHAECDHPSVARLFDARLDGEIGGLSVEWIGGASAHSTYAGKPAAKPEEAVALVALVARSVQHIHDCGVLHGDLKPGNILLPVDGVPRVIDFGSAVRLPVRRDAAGPRFLSGTPVTMAPETMCEGAAVDCRADVYLLGVLLFFCLAGCFPHVGRQPSVLLRLKLDEKTPHLQAYRPTMVGCDELDAIIRKALSADPGARYASASAFAGELESWLHDAGGGGERRQSGRNPADQ